VRSVDEQLDALGAGEVAGEIGVSPCPVMISVAVAAAASFLTPIATPANLMIMGPGGYRFGADWSSACRCWRYLRRRDVPGDGRLAVPAAAATLSRGIIRSR
jgi:hypothetical protein